MPTRVTTSLPDVTQFEVGDGNWNTDRAPIIHSIVLHTMVGTVDGANARFNTPDSQVSAHYGVGLDGKLYQWVDEDKVAFHAGDYLVNQSSIGIEHEDGTNPQTNPTGYNNPRPNALYEASAKLVADICKFYDFPADHDHIFRHQDVIDKQYYPGGTNCPDALDTDRIIKMANDILNPPVTVIPSSNPVESPTTTVASQPTEEPTQPLETPPMSSTTPEAVQSESVKETNIPQQTQSTTAEANSEASGQAGKVPFTVQNPVITPVQPKITTWNWVIGTLIWLLHLIGIERKIN